MTSRGGSASVARAWRAVGHSSRRLANGSATTPAGRVTFLADAADAYAMAASFYRDASADSQAARARHLRDITRRDYAGALAAATGAVTGVIR